MSVLIGAVVPESLPTAVGLCPAHPNEFYMPLEQGDSLRCPTCDETLIVYSRQPDARARHALMDALESSDASEEVRVAVERAWATVEEWGVFGDGPF